MDTRHEVDQLVLELQKVKQEVSGEGRGLGRSLCRQGQERSSRSFQQRPLRPSCSKQQCPEPVLLRIAVGVTRVFVTGHGDPTRSPATEPLGCQELASPGTVGTWPFLPHPRGALSWSPAFAHLPEHPAGS